jgi:transcriptional regulator with XRE-family HTH domain
MPRLPDQAKKRAPKLAEERADLVASTAPGLAKNLRELRKKQGLSQTALAERLGVHLTHVNRVEKGHVLPGLDFVVKAARILGVNVDALLAPGDDPLDPVRIEDREMSERLQLLTVLEPTERVAVIQVIDSMLTKHRMRQVLESAAHEPEPAHS